MVMAPDYGSLATFGRKVGRVNICGSCFQELRRKKYLHISEYQWLYPDGKISTSKRKQL
jgi:hypothetical protein